MSNRTLIPAFEAAVGDWKYYMCVMKYAEVSKISFAYEMGNPNTDLNLLIQRGLSPRTEDIKKYLLNSRSHFLGSMIVAAWGGEPEFRPLRMENPEGIAEGIDQAFGLLTFDGSQMFFALDGQHRLKAIKEALKQNPSLGSDEISILIVPHLDDENGRERTRRLFTNINRNAKSTTTAENIALDVDDAYAILTRRLLTDHPFLSVDGVVRIFRSFGAEGEFQLALSNINRTDKAAWSTITVLYDLLKGLGFGLPAAFLDPKVRPSDDDLEIGYEALTGRLDGLLSHCGNMLTRYKTEGARQLRVPASDPGAGHPLMRPVVQKAVVHSARQVIDQGRLDWPGVLAALEALEWKLSSPPFSAVWTTDGGRMQTGKDFVDLLKEMLIVHLAPSSKAQIQRARKEWKTLTSVAYPLSEERLTARDPYGSARDCVEPMAVEILPYAFDEVGKAPQGAGLYAWYGRPTAGPADWADEQSLRNFLAFHTRRFVTPTLGLSAKTTFHRTWAGELAETTSATFDVALGLLEANEAGDPPPQTDEERARRRVLSSAFETVCASDTMRLILVEALNTAIPILAGPLYVGIGKKLRRRLRQHKAAFEKLQAERPDEERLAELLRDDKNFAARALSRGFSPEHLEVWCMPLPAADVAGQDAMLPAVEFFLNRWHHPPFGRR